MKKTTLFVLLLFVFTSSYSQKELWGYKAMSDGLIIKAPLEGPNQDPEVVHTFDATGLSGKYPRGRLLQASNGKLYGITAYDGDSGQGIPQGVLFEYDPIVDIYKVLTDDLITAASGTIYGVIEPLPGILYGTTNGGNAIFKYQIDTEEMSIVASIPPFMYNNSNMYPRLVGELMKASDGNLYAVTQMAPSSQNAPFPGGIYKLNLATGQISKVYVFAADGSDVVTPVYDTKLVEGAPGKLYGTAYGGQHYGPQGVAPLGSGTLFEYTIATSTLVKKFDFDFETIGANPGPLTKSGDKLYGTLSGLSNNFNNYPNAGGSIFEYDLAAGSLTVLHAFDYNSDDLVQYPSGLLLKATDGNLYGSSFTGIFKFDPVTATVTKKINSNTTYDSQAVIEVCRKPSYHLFDTAAFTVCENTPFTFDVQNTNATGYVWKKGSTVVASQTTGILDISNLTLADTGIYTCTMINACGTTVTMPLQLTVEACLGIDEATGLKNAVKLYPSPARDILHIKLPDAYDLKVQNVSILTMPGQTVYNGDGNITGVDISALSAGMYQLLLTTDKGNWNGKFIKE